MRRVLPGILGLGIAILLVTGALGQPNAAIEESYDSDCYSCHWNWSPVAMKTMYRIQPPSVTGDVGGVMDIVVQVDNAWIAELVHFEPVLDISQAPSLTFLDGQDPLVELLDGTITVNPATPTAPQVGEVPIHVAGNTTDLLLRVTPVRTGPTGPDITVLVFPPAHDEPALTVNDAGRGAAETVAVSGADAIANLGLGDWRIEVQAPFEPGVLAEPRFTVDHQAYYNSSASDRQFLVRDAVIAGGASTLFTWSVMAAAEPSADEVALVTVNATAYYDHSSPTDPDYGNFTKSIEVPVKSGGAGKVTVGTAGTAVDPAAVLNAGPSMARISEAVGYATAFLLIGSVWSGGLFGKASRRQLNRVFSSARRRVAFHNFVSYGLTVAALVHLILFIIETNYEWTLGIIWGGIAFLAMIGLGVTGAMQVPMIRRWNYPSWRWTHLVLAIASIVFTIVHLLLDGTNFGFVQEAIGYEDPFPDKGQLS